MRIGLGTRASFTEDLEDHLSYSSTGAPITVARQGPPALFEPR